MSAPAANGAPPDSRLGGPGAIDTHPGEGEQELTEEFGVAMAALLERKGVPADAAQQVDALVEATQEVRTTILAGPKPIRDAALAAIAQGTIDDDVAAAYELALAKLTVAQLKSAVPALAKPEVAGALEAQLLQAELALVAASQLVRARKARIEELLVNSYGKLLGAGFPVLAELMLAVRDTGQLGEADKQMLEQVIAASAYAQRLGPGTAKFLEGFLATIKKGSSPDDVDAAATAQLNMFVALHGQQKQFPTEAALDNEIGFTLYGKPHKDYASRLGSPPPAARQRSGKRAPAYAPPLDTSAYDLFSGEQLETIRKIADQIRKVGGKDAKILALPVVVEQQAAKGGVWHVEGTMALWRVATVDGKTIAYVDAAGFRYSDIADFIKHGGLPYGRFVIPKSGQLTLTADGKIDVYTPAPEKIETGWDKAEKRGAVALQWVGMAGGIFCLLTDFVDFGASTPLALACFSAARMVGGSLALAGVGVSAASAGSDLYNRSAHGRSWYNGETVGDWLAVASVPLTAAAMTAPKLLGALAPRLGISTSTAATTAKVITGTAAAANWSAGIVSTADAIKNWDQLSESDKALAIASAATMLFHGAANTVRTVKGKSITQRAADATAAHYANTVMADAMRKTTSATARPALPRQAPTRVGKIFDKWTQKQKVAGLRLPPPSRSVVDYLAAQDRRAAAVGNGATRSPGVDTQAEGGVSAPSATDGPPLVAAEPGADHASPADQPPSPPVDSTAALEVEDGGDRSAAPAADEPASTSPDASAADAPVDLKRILRLAALAGSAGAGLVAAENPVIDDVAKYGGPLAYIVRALIIGGTSEYSKFLARELAAMFDEGRITPEKIQWYFDRVARLGRQYTLPQKQIDECDGLTRQFQADVKALLEEPLRAPVETEDDRLKQIIELAQRYNNELDAKLGFATRTLSETDPQARLGGALRLLSLLTFATNFATNFHSVATGQGGVQPWLFSTAYVGLIVNDAMLYASGRFGPKLATQKMPVMRWLPIVMNHVFAAGLGYFTAHDVAAGRPVGAATVLPIVAGALINGVNGARGELSGRGPNLQLQQKAALMLSAALVTRLVLQLAYYNQHSSEPWATGQPTGGGQPTGPAGGAGPDIIALALQGLLRVRGAQGVALHESTGDSAKPEGVLAEGALVQPTGKTGKDERGREWIEVYGYDPSGKKLGGWVERSGLESWASAPQPQRAAPTAAPPPPIAAARPPAPATPVAPPRRPAAPPAAQPRVTESRPPAQPASAPARIGEAFVQRIKPGQKPLPSEDEQFEIDLHADRSGTVRRKEDNATIDVRMDPDGTIRDGNGTPLFQMLWIDGKFAVVALAKADPDPH